MRRCLLLLVILALGWVAVPAHADDDVGVDAQTASAWLAEAAPRIFADVPHTGLAVTVVADGETVLAQGLGVALKDPETPVDPALHQFRVGSVTKLFSALAVMQLVDAGQLDLDADVSGWLDFDLQLPLSPITLRHLLSHTAGFEEALEGIFLADAADITDLRTFLADGQPRQVYEPGTVVAYSNYSATLAGHLVERASGQTWEDYVEHHIIAPLGLTSTSVRQPTPEPGRLARAYPDGGRQPLPFEYLNDAPAGVISSTATDMATFAQFLLDGNEAVLSQEAHRLWLAGDPVAGLGGLERGGHVALGVAHSGKGEVWALGHGGDTLAYHSSLLVWPEHGVAIFATATDSALVGMLTDDFFDTFLAADPVPVEPSPAAAEQARAVAEHTWTSARRNPSVLATISAPVLPASPHPDGDVSFAGQRFAWVDDWQWQDPTSGDPLVARAVDGHVDAIQFNPYMTHIPGGTPTTTVAIVALISLAVLLVFSIAAGISWLLARRRPDVAPAPRWYRWARALGPWLPVIAIAGIAAKAAAGWGTIQAFILPGPTIPDFSGNRPLEVLGSGVMVVAFLAAAAMLVVLVRHARTGRWRRAVGWALAFVAACALFWALGQVGLLFAPVLI